jgi:hypothetical protein
MNNPEQRDSQPTPRRFWLWFGVIFATLFSLAVGIVGFFVYQTYSIGKNITSPTPTELPVASPDQEKIKELGDRISSFQTAINEDKPAELILSAQDLNTLIALEPDFASKIYFDIQGDQVSMKGTLPLGSVPGLEGRFLNGTIAMKISLQDQKLVIKPTKIVLDNPDMPGFVQDTIMDSIKKQNLAEEALKEPEFQKWLKTIKDIKVSNGKIIITR